MSVRPGELPVVVGVDGSEPSLRAMDWAADEAALRGLPLRLVYASLWERYEGTSLAADLDKPSEEVSADDIVAAAARRARSRHPDLTLGVDVLPEEPEYALVRESRSATVLVTGTRGRSGSPRHCWVPSAWRWPATRTVRRSSCAATTTTGPGPGSADASSWVSGRGRP